MTVQNVTLTDDPGESRGVFVEITPVQDFTDAGGNVHSGKERYTFDGTGGTFSKAVVASDSTGNNPSGVRYNIRRVYGNGSRAWTNVLLLKATATVALSGLVESPGVATVPSPVLTVNGEPPDAAGDVEVATSSGATLPADAAGWLHDNGSGTLAWTTPTKTDIGLPNVDNTADTNKPVSTAQAAADTTNANAITAEAATARAAEATKAADSSVVHLTGNETVNGVKTLGSFPLLPSTPSTARQAVPKDYADAGDTTNASAITAEAATRASADAAEVATRASADTANASAAAAAQTTANAALPKAGGTMAGDIVLAGNAPGNLNPTTLQQVNALIAAAVATLIGGADTAHDTLVELQTLLNTDESTAAALATTVAGKLAKASNLSDLVDAVAARSNLGLGTAATQNTTAFDAAGLAAAAQAASQPLDSDLSAIAALTTTSFGRAFLELANAAAGRTALGLGTAAVAATGDFDAAGAAAAAQAASQPVDSDLTAIAALTTTSFGRGLLALADAAALRTSAGLVPGTDVQAYDAELAALAALTSAADRLPYFTGSAAAALATFTAAGRALVDDADAAAQRTTLGLGNVDNTADTGKPVSTAQQTALDAKISKSLYDANTILKADTDDTPAALTMGASTILARLASGSIKAATPAELKTLLAIATGDVSGLGTVATHPVGDLLQVTNNLSDLANAGTSRLNLAVPMLYPALVASTANIASLSGLPTTDGVTLTDGQIVLCTAQTTGSQNGPWAVHSGAWTRPADYAAGAVAQGRTIQVLAGTVNAGSLWFLSTTGTVTVDTTSTTWVVVNNKAGAVVSSVFSTANQDTTQSTSLVGLNPAISCPAFIPDGSEYQIWARVPDVMVDTVNGVITMVLVRNYTLGGDAVAGIVDCIEVTSATVNAKGAAIITTLDTPTAGTSTSYKMQWKVGNAAHTGTIRNPSNQGKNLIVVRHP